ncbi:hypothetical protein IP92_03959 [Pseudoduganella flava]|uniref:Lipocalin-like domain-containing protein n=1 Tax=Pseudoduganella flava TaxID=871742 RepID=A0A562PK40_9BURK|nr:hypothetical protein [Pseudoduganella flava]QGZ42252.1 hypothetical protein GO485_26555 [Pseudoduganella flava]TWI44789.1 hypothetical protein IP92_03959 [Pseudoduganella flava]
MPILWIAMPLNRPRVIALSLATALLQPALAADAGNRDLLGKWRLTKVLDSSEISALDDREAARLVGETLVIAQDEISLAGETCKEPEFERHIEDTVRYLREEAHAASGKLVLPAFVEVVDLACTEVLRKNDTSIVLYWKGFFFEAVMQEPGARMPSPKN